MCLSNYIPICALETFFKVNLAVAVKFWIINSSRKVQKLPFRITKENKAKSKLAVFLPTLPNLKFRSEVGMISTHKNK